MLVRREGVLRRLLEFWIELDIHQGALEGFVKSGLAEAVLLHWF
jgi:hypothetical protein